MRMLDTVKSWVALYPQVFVQTGVKVGFSTTVFSNITHKVEHILALYGTKRSLVLWLLAYKKTIMSHFNSKQTPQITTANVNSWQ